MTTKKILAIAIAACLCLTSAPGQGGFNLEPGPFQKVERSPFIVVGHVKEVGQTVTVVVSQKIRGEEEISDVQIPGQPRDIEDRIIRYTVGESLILYLKKDGTRFDLIQGGYGVQIASESNINAVKDGVALLVAPKNKIAGLLKQMLERTDSHKHMAIDYLLTQKTDLMSDDDKSLIVSCTIPLLESDDISIRRDAARILGEFKA
ncbi:MAG TPA: hypothetical protein VK141_06175, partial [Nitrosomonas sp.]|nr:hypothetical protein [Nitrosomonas sp.]